VVLYSPDSRPLERYVFSTDLFPVVESGDLLVPFDSAEHDPRQSSSPDDSRPTTPTPQGPDAAPHTPRMLELASQLAAVLSRISAQAAKLDRLPKGCKFTVAIELRDPPAGQVPIGNQATWLPAELGLQPSVKMQKGERSGGAADSGPPGARQQRRDEFLGGLQTMAVRLVEAGPFVMEVWIEESKEQRSPTKKSDASKPSQVARHAHFEDTGK
jgi:mitotic spindle assembly checkpoint protein MAD2B